MAVRPDGGRVRIRSGIHDAEGWHDKALDYIDTHLADEGVGLRWIARHVEVKAARMLAEQPYLPAMIPRGSVLTVIEVDGTRVTYEGTGTR